MRSWPRPDVPSLPGEGATPVVYDTASASLLPLAPADGVARLYVCGITPYDATHLGHASTYLAFDTLSRVWLDAGFEVRYAQNVTDVDDPLLERAQQTGVEWQALASEQVELFRADMTSLRILPPQDYIAVSEVIDDVAAAVARLEERGIAYRVAAPDAFEPDSYDLYFDSLAAAGPAWHLGTESNLDEATMNRFFAERGGDPDRPGKRHALDPLLWLAARPDEPSWPSVVGRGRPGWHIECSVIAFDALGAPFTVQGGGSDLVFPHHEYSAGHAAALTGERLASAYVHAGMVAYEGEKMSKSLGNLVLVSRLREAGTDPRSIRLALLARHYRSDGEWTDTGLEEAVRRLSLWTGAFLGASRPSGTGSATDVLAAMRSALADDLDTPEAIAILDEAAASGVDTPRIVVDAIDALLGIRLGDEADISTRP